MIKKIVAFLAILLFSFSISFSQWTWLNPKPSGYSCSKIVFTDELKGFILKGDGDLVTTTDQGGTWSFRQNFPNTVTMDLKDSTGVICGYFGSIYVSKDNGYSWVKRSTPLSDHFFTADVVSKDTIFLASTIGKVFRSDDGGNTWKTFDCGIQISSMEFVNSKVGFIGGRNQYILKTEDGGATWQQNVSVNRSPSNTMTIKFIDVNNGFAFREHSDLLSTTDGGQTWTTYNVSDDIYSFHFINKTTGFACGEYGIIYRTDNGGASWNWISPTSRIYAYDLYSTYFINSNTGFAVGARGRILKTTDGGVSWNYYSPFYTGVSDISMPTNQTGYVTVGNTIYKTIDSGQSWKALPFTVGTEYASYSHFQYCHFFSADTGLVTATDYTRLYKTYDGGESWKLISPSQYGFENVGSLQFIDKNTGFVALNISYGSEIAKTIDGGETWTKMWSSQYYGEVFQKIHFIDEKTGYASRYEKLYKTEDSAKTWTELAGVSSNNITSICFTNPATGFVAGENAQLKQTRDSGKTWTNTTIANQFYDDIYTIKFINQKVGYLTAENGAIYKTTDSGYTWQPNGRASFYRMNAITYSPDSSVYIAGENGAILRSDTREKPATQCTQNEWTGTAGTSWETPENWSCGTVPGPTANVVIKPGAVVIVGYSATVNTLTINPGATLSLAPGSTLTVLH